MTNLEQEFTVEVCSTVSTDIIGSLAGLSDFSEMLCRKRAAIQVIFLRTMFAKAKWTVIIIRNPRHQQFLHPSIEKSRVVAILYSGDSN